MDNTDNTLLLILNPEAGLRYARKFLPEIIALFTDYGYQCLVFVTEKRGDATEFVKKYGERVKCIVSIGGDGTFNETSCRRASIYRWATYPPAAQTTLPTVCTFLRIL